jgi:hypothetical protein
MLHWRKYRRKTAVSSLLGIAGFLQPTSCVTQDIRLARSAMLSCMKCFPSLLSKLGFDLQLSVENCVTVEHCVMQESVSGLVSSLQRWRKVGQYPVPVLGLLVKVITSTPRVHTVPQRVHTVHQLMTKENSRQDDVKILPICWNCADDGLKLPY